MQTEIDRTDGGVIVRGYAMHGLYWRQPLVLSDAAYLPDDRVVMTVCRLKGSQGAMEPYSEFDSPRVEEFRLLAALSLAVGYDEGLISVQPLSVTLLLPDVGRPFDAADLADLQNPLLTHWKKSQLPSMEGPYPPADLGAYQFRDDVAPLVLQSQLYAAIDPEDQLMNRGLRSLVRFAMLSRHPMFSEEATYPLHVALDASFSIFRRQFAREGNTDATSRDVAARFEQIFNEKPSGQNYFEDYYIDRVMAQHPQSRYGESHYVPGTYGERLWLFKALREVYRYLLLGQVVNPQRRDQDDRARSHSKLD